MTIEELSARLEKVERANRRMRAGAGVALVIAAAAFAMGQAVPPPKVIQAERFEVLGNRENVRASLGMSLSGPEVILYSSEGKPRFNFALYENGSGGVYLKDKSGEFRVILRVTPGGSPHLSLLGADGKPRVDCEARDDRAASLHLYSDDGKVLERLPK